VHLFEVEAIKSKGEPSIMHVAVIESDPLRFAGFRAVLESESDLQLSSLSLSDVETAHDIDLVLVGESIRQNAFRRIESLRAVRPDLRILVTGSGISDDIVLNSLLCGAKGYIDEASSSRELGMAIRAVAQGLVWASRRVLAIFIERSGHSAGGLPIGARRLTIREKEVLNLLVEGRPNREIGRSLGIEERTVKAHVAKLMRKAGVQNRIMLSMHAITHAMVSAR
jgi:DNA-binding NarL/FixJ family response regulator